MFIVFVQCSLCKSNCCTDCWIKALLPEHPGCEDFIDIVHGWDDHGKVWHSAREEEHCVLEDLGDWVISQS